MTPGFIELEQTPHIQIRCFCNRPRAVCCLDTDTKKTQISYI